MENCITFWLSVISTILSIVAILWTIIIYQIRPNLAISIPEIATDKSCIKVKIKNKKSCSNAVNVNIEMCTVNENEQTSHLEIDRSDFLIIPPKKDRDFKSYTLSPTTKYAKKFDSFIEEKVKNENYTFRVRAYATHSFSGLGEAFESKFRYDIKTGQFKIDERN